MNAGPSCRGLIFRLIQVVHHRLPGYDSGQRDLWTLAMPLTLTGAELREIRARQGLTQDDFADHLNRHLGRSYAKTKISRWETGAEGPEKRLPTDDERQDPESRFL